MTTLVKWTVILWTCWIVGYCTYQNWVVRSAGEEPQHFAPALLTWFVVVVPLTLVGMFFAMLKRKREEKE